MRDEEMADVAETRPKIRSTVTQVRKQRGRGFNEEEAMDVDDRRQPAAEVERSSKAGPVKSVEGWVIFISNVHEEANEEQLTEVFLDFGPIKNLYLNLDRRSGFCKGYALVEYDQQKEAQNAIDEMDGQEFLEQPIKVTWCFGSGPIKRKSTRK